MKLRRVFLFALTAASAFGVASASRAAAADLATGDRATGDRAVVDPAAAPGAVAPRTTVPVLTPAPVAPRGAAAASPPPGTSPAATTAAPAAANGSRPAAARGSGPAPAAGSTASARTDSPVAPAVTFDTFRVVSERNIFNPNRTGRRERVAEEKAPRLDVISLVGTMDSDRGLRAFFDGSEARYRRAVQAGESIETFKVTKIAPTAVELEREGKTLSLLVGQQLRRPEGLEWSVVGEDVVRRDADARAAADAKVDPSTPAPIPAGASDVEKRMRDRRNKDLKN